MTVNWGLGVMPDIGGNALAAFQNAGQLRQQTEQRNALLDIQRQQEERLRAEQQNTQQRQQMEQRRADLPMLERLLTDVTPENYGQRLQIAQQYGVDTSQLPQQFDPGFVQQQLATVKLLNSPQGQEAMSAAGKIAQDMGFRPGTPEYAAKVTEIWTAESTKFLATQPGGGVASVAPGQAAQFVIAPNDGSQTPGAPAGGAIPPPPAGFVIDNGGPASQAPGNFLSSVRGLPGETVTSTTRSAARNRAVGGVANSYHLSGRARDSVPPPGMSMAEYHRRLQAANPNLDVINEGDHVHMEPRG